MSPAIIASLVGIVISALSLLVLSLYAFALRDHHPERYTGVWRYLGEGHRTRTRAVSLASGLIIGGLVANGITLVVRPTAPQMLALQLFTLFLVIIVIGVVLSVALRGMQRQLDAQDRED